MIVNIIKMKGIAFLESLQGFCAGIHFICMQKQITDAVGGNAMWWWSFSFSLLEDFILTFHLWNNITNSEHLLNTQLSLILTSESLQVARIFNLAHTLQKTLHTASDRGVKYRIRDRQVSAKIKNCGGGEVVDASKRGLDGSWKDRKLEPRKGQFSLPRCFRFYNTPPFLCSSLPLHTIPLGSSSHFTLYEGRRHPLFNYPFIRVKHKLAT